MENTPLAQGEHQDECAPQIPLPVPMYPTFPSQIFLENVFIMILFIYMEW